MIVRHVYEAFDQIADALVDRMARYLDRSTIGFLSGRARQAEFGHGLDGKGRSLSTRILARQDDGFPTELLEIVRDVSGAQGTGGWLGRIPIRDEENALHCSGERFG